MKTLNIDKEFQALIAPLTHEEEELLTENIKRDGCLTPLVVWNNTIVDGHNRYEICTANNIEFSTVEREFENRDAVIVWMINNQLGRRNINNFYRGKLALAKKEIIAKIAKERQREHGNTAPGRTLNPTSDEVKKPVNTLSILAKESGIGHDTINKVSYIIKNAPEQIIRKLETNEMTINQGYQELRMAQEKREDREGKPASNNPYSIRITDEEVAKAKENIEALREAARKQRDIEARKEEQRQLKMSGVTSTADYYAVKAIAELSQIRKDDAGREVAMQRVIDWIEKNK